MTTWNPSSKDVQITLPSCDPPVWGVSSGKWYWEITVQAAKKVSA